MHEVYVLCACNDIEQCTMERYVSDVRILEARMRMQDLAIAFVVGAIVGTVLGIGGLAAYFALKWRLY